jgi:NADH-quinone oxidoreductase subunit G
MTDDTINIEVDGQPVQARRGQMIIEVTDAHDVHVPRFCYHPKLSIAANCRMCLVEVEKAPKPMPACATPVAEGMKIFTRSARAIAAQKATMEFLLINHPLDCPICDQGGECELQDISMGFGSDVSRFTERKRIVKDKNLGPLVSTDMTRCIHCTRCVRFGQEIAGIQELGTVGRGETTHIGTFIERSVDHELSGNIIDVCPVGALNNKPYRYRARAWELVQNEMVSPHDCVGSNLFAHTLRGRVMRTVPRENEAVNETWLADRDRFGCHGLYAPDRLERPMLRDGDEWREAAWEDALIAACDGLRETVDSHGADEVGLLVSPSATLEEQYLAARLVRGLGSQNVDHRLRRADFRAQETDPVTPQIGLPLADVDRLDMLLVVGSALRREAPILAHRVRKAALAGGRVAFLNPAAMDWRFPVMAERATKAGALAAELGCVLAAACAGDWSGMPERLAARLAAAAPGEDHRRIAAALSEEGSRAIWLGGLAEAHPGYAELQLMAQLLSARTGAVLGSISAGANSAGGALAGALPHRDVGGARVERPGRDAAAMLSAPLRAYVLVGVEPEADSLAGQAALEILSRADRVVAITAFATEAMRRYGHVLLPAGTAYETSGTFVNCEGRWQGFSGSASPVGEARPAWKILRVLGTQLGLEGFDYQTSADVVGELKSRLESDAARKDDGPDAAGRLAAMEPMPDVELPEVPMYGVDGLVRRSRPLQETAEAAAGRRTYR